MLCYSIIDVTVIGLCSDMGGSNEGLHTLLESIGSSGKVTDDMTILPDHIVMTPSFINALYCLCAWACATHCGKCTRNPLLRSVRELPESTTNRKSLSQTKIKKEPSQTTNNKIDSNTISDFKRALVRECLQIVWGSIERMYERERQQSNISKNSGLTYASVHVDDWNKQKVSIMLQPFSSKAISSMISHICGELQYDVLKNIPARSFESNYKWYLRIFKSLLAQAKKEDQSPKPTAETIEDLGFLQYSIVFHGLFHERFLCRNVGITSANIESETKELTEIMSYFSSWRMEVVSLRGHDDNWSKKFISAKTFHNLRKLVSGFLAYCRTVLKMDKDSFILYLHANESTIEALFSYARGIDKDNPLSYPTAVAGNSYSFSATKLLNNKMYSGEHIDDESAWCDSKYGATDASHITKEKKREKKLKEWESAMKEPEADMFNVFPCEHLDSIKILKRHSMLKVLLQEFRLKGSWQQCLLKRELGLLSKLSINTKHELWFESLYKLDWSRETIFNNFCESTAAVVLEILLICGKGSTIAPKMPLKTWSQRHILKSGLYCKSWEFMISDQFSTMYNKAFHRAGVPDVWKGESTRIGSISIFITVLEFIQDELHTLIVKNSVRQFNNNVDKPLNPVPRYETRMEVNRFVGSAVASSLKHVKNNLQKEQLLRLMGSPSVYFGEEYQTNNVSYRDRVMDKGGLTYLTPMFFEFGLAIMNVMATYDLSEMISTEGAYSIIKFREEIQRHPTIIDAFSIGISKSKILFDKEVKKWVYNMVLLKCCNSFNKAQVSVYKSDVMLQNCAGLDKMKFRQQLKAGNNSTSLPTK